MGMGMKSLKWEGIGTKNLFPHTSIINTAVGCHYFPPGLQSLSQPLTVQLCILSKKWGLAATDMWPCGKRQTMSHIVYSCPQTELEGGAAAIALS